MLWTRKTPQRRKAASNTFITSGERPRVRRRCFRGCLRTTRFDDNNRLAQRHFAGCGKKRPSVAHGFHVQKNAARIGIAAKIVDQFGPAYVQHGSRRNDRAKANFLLQAPIENRGFQCAALAQKCHVPGQCHIMGKCGIQARQRIHNAQAVRTDYAHLAGTKLRSNLFVSGAGAVPAPRSLKPAEITTAERTPAFTHSPINPGTDGAGVTMTARSTGFGGLPISL